MTNKAILLIDGENFRKSTKTLLYNENKNFYKYDYQNIKLRSLLDKVFSNYKDIDIIEIRYYGAKLKMYQESKKKSKKMISDQRRLITNLSKQNINFVFKGNVRRRKIEKKNGDIEYTFVEKGVDVAIAVDMLSLAYDKIASTIILCSSDSDLQPAVKETRKRGVEIIYLGFNQNPNRGLQASTNKTILFDNQGILDALPRKNTQQRKRRTR